MIERHDRYEHQEVNCPGCGTVETIQPLRFTGPEFDQHEGWCVRVYSRCPQCHCEWWDLFAWQRFGEIRAPRAGTGQRLHPAYARTVYACGYEVIRKTADGEEYASYGMWAGPGALDAMLEESPSETDGNAVIVRFDPDGSDQVAFRWHVAANDNGGHWVRE